MISISELSQCLKISTTAVEKTRKRLKAKGMLQRIGSATSTRGVSVIVDPIFNSQTRVGREVRLIIGDQRDA